MASLISGYEYDIFISYRQKDNKYDGWVTEFVDNLKRELEATFKEEVSVYFDISPHDGLLETHEVADSLEAKLKCLIFIPIISRTYCDPKSFAWEQEFKAFIELASKDRFGLKVKLQGGNVASRVLPVRIHDLDAEDIKLIESFLGGYLRGVEFIYKEPGVNRPLTPGDDDDKNLNKTRYRNQINKVANAVKEIVSGLSAGEDVSGKEKTVPQLPWEEPLQVKRIIEGKKEAVSIKKRLLTGIASILILALLVIYAYPKLFKRDTLESLRDKGDISVAVFPFQNMTSDTTWNIYRDVIQTSLISSLANSRELQVRQQESVKTLFQNQGLSEYASISPVIAGTIAGKLDADVFIYGGIQQAGTTIRISTQITNTKTKNIIKSFEITGSYESEKIFEIADSLRKSVTDFLLVSKLIKENPELGRYPLTTRSPEAFRYFIYAKNAENTAVQREDWATSRDWCLKALAIDSNYDAPMYTVSTAYNFLGNMDSSLYWINKLYRKKDLWPDLNRIAATSAYAAIYESYEERIKYLRQMLQIDNQLPGVFWVIGNTYIEMRQYQKAIPELEKAIEIYHKWGVDVDWYYRDLGNAYHGIGQYKKEKALYKKAEKYVKEIDQSLIHRRAVLSLSEGDTVSAREQIEKLISSCKNNSISEAEINRELGWIYWEAEKHDQAEEYFRKALVLEPANPGMMNTLACRLIESNKNYDEILKLLDMALELAPDKWYYYLYLDSKCWGLIRMGRNKEALEILEKVWKTTPYHYYFLKARLEEARKAVVSEKM